MKKATAAGSILFLLISALFLFPLNHANAETIDLKFATFFSPKHTLHVGVWEPWAKKISEQTNGRVKITMFPGGALGKAGDHYALVENGIADIVYILHDYIPGRFPMTTVFELPFMAPSSTQTSKAMWKTFENSPDFQKEYARVKVLALFCHPPGHFHTTKKPVKKIDDLKGLKIRTVSPAVTDALKIYGAIPVEMPITDTYTSLERGVVDGTVIDWGGLETFKLNDLVKYTTESDFYVVTMAVLMNKRKWESLPEDIQKIMAENTGLSMSLECGKVYDDTDGPAKQRMTDAGVKVVQFPDEDLKKLNEQTIPQRKAWVKEMKSKGLDGEGVLNTALKYLSEE
ncbi:MAG: TRAP transporter substrate-binding protein [Desulfobacteraceae bacterium]|jgi:TRAP-type C4-dicarboxylate transport system substrate-binding protein